MNALSLITGGHVPYSRTLLLYLSGLAAQVAISPDQAQSLLTTPLVLPLLASEAKGIFQSDIILRTAIIAAIADIRANPWLLDYVFASLATETLTLNKYGEKEIQNAKNWFMKTNIPVFMIERLGELECPSITIQLLSSNEVEETLGDVHYIPTQDVNAGWPSLSDSFTPVAYTPSTGIMKVPTAVSDQLVIAPGMLVMDKVGRTYPVVDVLDAQTFTIAPGVVTDFGSAVIKPSKPAYVARLESLSFRESYQIGCHIKGEPVHLSYLHSILTFVLLRYKQSLLEARGFERTTLSSTDIRRDELGEGTELIYTRYINITGYVRQYWPKAIDPKIQYIQTQIQVEGGAKLPGPTPPEDSAWIGDQDSLLVK